MAVIKDVAKLSGVSVGTVSKYLNNPQTLRSETRQRVEAAIETYIEEIQSKIPIVLLNWDINNTKFNCVSIDVFEGMFKSTNHLISLGHKNIAYIGGHEKTRISGEKFYGYMKAMKNASLDIRPELIFRGDFNLKTGYYAAKKCAMNRHCPQFHYQ